MRRVVLDTNILTAGLRSSVGASFAILRMVAERRIRPLATTSLFLEYESVLTRREQIASHGRTLSEINSLLAEFAALSEAVEAHFLWRPMLSDPKDEMVLEAAVNGRADALITFNVRDFAAARDRFDLNILRPADFLQRIRRK